MENSEPSPPIGDSVKASLDESDSNWSDIDSADEAPEEDDGERSLRIDLHDDEDTEVSKQDLSSTHHKSPVRRHSNVLAFIGSSKKTKLLRQKRKAMSKKRLGLKKIEVPEEIVKSAEAFEEGMEKIANRLKLNRTQVKSVIRKLVEAPELLNVVQQIAGESESSEDPTAAPEMRMTRTIAKNVAQGGGKLNWFLEKVHEKTPVKKKTKEEIAVPFIAAELPDEDDEEYDPSKDAVDVSDEESIASASDTGTPLSSLITSPSMTCSMSASPSTSSAQDSMFKKPSEISGAVRSLNFDSPRQKDSSRMTRSRANLKEVSIEELDTKFVPPDFTEDMYETEIDDYAIFLAETYGKPVEKGSAEDEKAKKKTEDDEEEKDPDFVYQEQEDLYDLIDEFKFNRSTKISQKEADLLMQELFEAYDLDQKTQNSRSKGDHHQQLASGSSRNAENSHTQFEELYFPPPSQYQLTNDQRLLLAQQMRQHIQLLTQMTLLSSKDDLWKELYTDCRAMLSECSTRASNPYSVYNQDNLASSIQLTDEWDRSGCLPGFVKGSGPKAKYELSDELINFMADKRAFVYPSLLPTSSLKPSLSSLYDKDSEKPYFAKGEDNLIALGLEHFFGGTDKWSKANNKKGLTEACNFISSSMMRGKTTKHIRIRIKNRKDKYKVHCSNPITYYFEHNYAPREAMKELCSYDPSAVVAPMFADPKLLPGLWRERLKKPILPENVTVVAAPPPLQPILPITVTVREMVTPLFTITPQLDMMVLDSQPAPQLETMPVAQRKDVQQLPKKTNPSKSSSAKRGPSNLYVPILPKDQKPDADAPLPKIILLEQTSSVNQQRMTPSKSNEKNTVLETAMEECGFGHDMPFIATPQKSTANTEGATANTDDLDNEISPTFSSPTMLPSSSSSSGVQKSTRKSKQQKEAELTLQLLEAEKPDEEALRKQHEALEISINAQEQLSSEKWEQFCKIVVDGSISNKQRFMQLHNLCAGKMELQELLLDLLTPPEAMEIGIEVYSQFCSRDAMKKFFRKVRISFSNQPSIHTKILREMQAVLSNPDVKTEEISAIGQKYFKSNQLLLDEFMSFVSGVPYPEGLLPDPEVIDLSDEEDEDKGTFDEKINLMGDEEDDLGGDNCPCACHPTPGTASHCMHCSLKFVNGKVYSRDAKVLRPVNISYPSTGKRSKGKKRQKRRK